MKQRDQVMVARGGDGKENLLYEHTHDPSEGSIPLTVRIRDRGELCILQPGDGLYYRKQIIRDPVEDMTEFVRQVANGSHYWTEQAQALLRRHNL